MIKYTISKHLGQYILFKESYTEHGMACMGIFKGSYLECRSKRKELINGK